MKHPAGTKDFRIEVGHGFAKSPFKSSPGELKGPFDFMYDGKKMELKSSMAIPHGGLMFIGKDGALYSDNPKMLWGNRPAMVILDDMEDTGPVVNKEINAITNKIMEEKMNEVTITKVTNGFIVKVGCMTLVSKSWKEISTELEKFWKDPQGMQEKYQKIRDGRA